MRAKQDAGLLASAQRVRMRGHELAEERVELARRNAGFPAFEGGVERAHDAVCVPAGLGRQVDTRCPLDLHQLSLQLVLDLLLAILIHQVPLVGDDDERSARVDDLLDDAYVLLGQGSGPVDENQGDLGLFDSGLRADGRVVVRTGRAVHLTADAGGVDEPPGTSVQLDEFVDGVAGCTRKLVDDDALAASQRIEQ